MYLSTDGFGQALCHSWIVVRHVAESIRRVPRRTIGITMPAIARPNASSRGVNVVTPVAFCVLLAACDGSLRSLALELLSATTLWPRRACPPSCAKPSERTTRARSIWLVRFCSIVQCHPGWPKTWSACASWDRPQRRKSAPEIPPPTLCVPGKASVSGRGYPAPGKGRPKRKSLRSKYVRGKNANTGENRTCAVSSAYCAVKGTLRFVGIGRNGSSCGRVRRIRSRWNIASSIHASSALGKAKAQNFSLENTFPDGNGIARLDRKPPPLPLVKRFALTLKI